MVDSLERNQLLSLGRDLGKLIRQDDFFLLSDSRVKAYVRDLVGEQSDITLPLEFLVRLPLFKSYIQNSDCQASALNHDFLIAQIAPVFSDEIIDKMKLVVSGMLNSALELEARIEDQNKLLPAEGQSFVKRDNNLTYATERLSPLDGYQMNRPPFTNGIKYDSQSENSATQREVISSFKPVLTIIGSCLIAGLTALGLGAYFIFPGYQMFTQKNARARLIRYTDFLESAETGQIKEIQIVNDCNTAYLMDRLGNHARVKISSDLVLLDKILPATTRLIFLEPIRILSLPMCIN